jgi:hypothetical protein
MTGGADSFQDTFFHQEVRAYLERQAETEWIIQASREPSVQNASDPIHV